jgi:hypothetical protein
MDGAFDGMQMACALLYICPHLMVTYTSTCHILSKIYSTYCTAIFLAKRIVAMTYAVTHKVRNILTRNQLSVAHEEPCSIESVNIFKKLRTLSYILNKAGDVLGMRNLYNAE